MSGVAVICVQMGRKGHTTLGASEHHYWPSVWNVGDLFLKSNAESQSAVFLLMVFSFPIVTQGKLRSEPVFGLFSAGFFYILFGYWKRPFLWRWRRLKRWVINNLSSSAIASHMSGAFLLIKPLIFRIASSISSKRRRFWLWMEPWNLHSSRLSSLGNNFTVLITTSIN